ncbi:hypothetical protein [Sphingomonas sp. LT1P40]|uniref:hypothetical protein n=1 Tax=Alteristakelama amylovorans TaxID=3096166 RepID=UPI002FC77B05
MDIHLARGDTTYHLSGLSYLSAVLDDVVAAAVAVSLGQMCGEAVFNLEPGRLRLSCIQEYDWGVEARRVFLRVDSSQSDYGDPMPFAWDELWVAELDHADEFASAVLSGAKELEARHGHDGYYDQWVESPFPVRGVAALAASLEIQSLKNRAED